MRLHHLRLQAFGPFAGVEEIDFDALSADGLHLIHGATGAGKTSILDAICFALFAGVPGGRMSGRDSLHSDHAAPTTRPEVELDFAVADRRFRVRRSPEHVVPKKRGTGTRAQRGSVQFEELRSNQWTTLTTRSDEAAQMIGDVLGMGLAQFAQVMLLPQGEFTAFLRAKADDRGKLLERLFDISDFAAIEQWLVEHRRTLESQVTHADAHHAALIARAQDALTAIPAGEGHGQTTLSELGPIDSVDALRGLRDRVSELLTIALADSDAADGQAELARTRLAHERALAGLQHQAFTAQQTLDRLAEQATTIEQATRRLDLASRAAACQPALAVLTRRERIEREARSRADDARRALEKLTAWPLPQAHGSRPLSTIALEPLRERGIAGTEALAGQAESERQHRSVQTELHTAGASRAKTAQDAAEARARVDSGSARLSRLAVLRDAQLAEARAHPQWSQLLTALSAATAATGSAAAEIREVADTADLHRAARVKWTDAEQEVLRLRQSRLAGIAAELAIDLPDGEPCPVCGSPDHPRPAHPAPDRVDAEQIAAAEEVLAAAAAVTRRAAAAWSSAVGRAQTTCQALLVSLESLMVDSSTLGAIAGPIVATTQSIASIASSHQVEVAALVTALGAESPTLSDRPAVLTSLATALDGVRAPTTEHASRAAQASQQVQVIDAQLHELRAKQVTAEQAAASAAEEARAAAAREESLRVRLAAVQDRLDELTDDHMTTCGCSTRADGARAHATCVALLDELLTATTAAMAASTERKAAQDELDRVLVEQDFPDAEAASQAILSDAERHQLREVVEAAGAERLKATGVLEQPDVATAAVAHPAQVDRITAESAAAELAARHTHDAVGDLRRGLQALERIATDLARHDERSAPLRDQLAVATSLASAVTGSGDNTMRMRLTAYVLAARLETITALANERLAVMTGGRYQLEHTDAKAGRGKSGLGLRVRDAWTGTARDTGTLSGGESFIASLALALGLGDAVLQAAGGRRLETLLVDEGFGSLDEDSLEQVLDVLDSLRAGGRSVGIVSHVAELRGRIPSQIRVHKSAAGSTLEVVTAGAA